MISTAMESLGLSQLFTVWLTYHSLVPMVVVGGMGAVALPVPPEEEVYHSSPVPVAVSATPGASWQKIAGDTTAGGRGYRVHGYRNNGCIHAAKAICATDGIAGSISGRSYHTDACGGAKGSRRPP